MIELLLPAQPAATSAPPPPAATPVAPVMEVSRTADLDPAGETVRVTGTGYDEARGIYIAFCVVPPPGQTPTPCGGGIDREGASGASQWISSAPPDYGVGVAQPYGPGGSFDVEVHVSAMLAPDIDCRLVQCAIVSRADHTRLTDRSLDVIIPVLFAAESPASTTAPAPTVPPTSSAPPTTAAGTTTTSPAVVAGPEETPPPRGAAATWPVWAATAAAAAALIVLATRPPAVPSHRRMR